MTALVKCIETDHFTVEKVCS